MSPHRSQFVMSMLWLGILSLPFAATAGEVYRWKDAQGVTHYGDRKPEDANVERLDVRVPPPASPTTVPEAGAAAPEQDAAAAAEKRNQERAMLCERARRNLEVLTHAENVSIRSEGSSEPMNAERRQLEIDANQRAVVQYCEPGAE